MRKRIGMWSKGTAWYKVKATQICINIKIRPAVKPKASFCIQAACWVLTRNVKIEEHYKISVITGLILESFKNI